MLQGTDWQTVRLLVPRLCFCQSLVRRRHCGHRLKRRSQTPDGTKNDSCLKIEFLNQCARLRKNRLLSFFSRWKRTKKCQFFHFPWSAMPVVTKMWILNGFFKQENRTWTNRKKLSSSRTNTGFENDTGCWSSLSSRGSNNKQTIKWMGVTCCWKLGAPKSSVNRPNLINMF